MAFIFSLGAVTLAEMGDKTQLLAMCFATRFSAKKVLIGVFIATILNHAAAVAAGYFLKEFLSSYSTWVHVIASLSFIGFGLWAIRGDDIDESCNNKTKYGPIMTVAIAFFIAEMGDKTQLTTVSLAAGFSNPLAVLIGTTLGMIVADGIGIIFGVIMNKRIPEKVVKWISASIFVLCGIIGYIEAASKLFTDLNMLLVSVFAILLVTAALAIIIIKTSKNEGVFDEIAEMNKKGNK